MNILKRKAAILAALTLVAGGLLVTSSVAQAQNTIYVQSKFNGRCVTASTGQNGAGVIMVDCQNALTQRWYWDGLKLRNADGGRCLTAAWGNGDNGAHLQMYDCQPGNNANQMFYRPASTNAEIGRIRSWLGGNRCIEIAGANWWQGASVQLWDCHGGGHQYWWA